MRSKRAKPSAPGPAPDDMPALRSLLERLDTPDLVFFPVRHHSPACSWHLHRLIQARRPRCILIEGPADLTPLVELILHPKTRAPFAVYTNYVDTGRQVTAAAEAEAHGSMPARFAAYYPFCDFTPELVALRTGAATGAALRFIDLTYPEQVLAERAVLGVEKQHRVDSLMAERHLQRSLYLKRLAERTGCRDQDDLWDHLFEVHYDDLPTPAFVRNVVAYCYMARVGCRPEELESDGTLPRERAMAVAIQAARRETPAAGGTGPVLVVTGGFHTISLPDLLQDGQLQRDALAPTGQVQHPVLVRYSFDQLDSLNGYASGMPSPQYYDMFWAQVTKEHPTPFVDTASRIIVDIGRLTREKQMPNALSSADEIAALAQARALAQFRGHPGPCREDILDGIRSCFIKGSMDAEGELLMGLARHVLSGTRIGDIPPEAGVPPLVEDFRALARALRLNIDDSARRKLSLDIYRKVPHRRISRLLHALEYLNAPFATLAGGPDFVRGTGLDRLHEHWEYGWSPRTESALVDAAVYGATVDEAATSRLREAMAALQTQGKARDAGAAVAMLIRACRMGLHEHTADLLSLIRHSIDEDGAFTSVTRAANQLLLLWQSREPLEAHRLPEIPKLLVAAYQRLCYLVDGLASCAPDDVLEALAALCMVRELLQAAGHWLDPELFWEALERLPRLPQANSAIAGGAAGLLYGRGRMPAEELLKLVLGQMNSATGDSRAKVGFLLGLLKTCRELAWQQPALLEAMNRLLGAWDEQEFIRVLPDLRLTFADLTPGETDRVASAVAGLCGEKGLGSLMHRDVSEAQLQFHIAVTNQVLESLKNDGLGLWAGSS